MDRFSVWVSMLEPVVIKWKGMPEKACPFVFKFGERWLNFTGSD